MLLQRVITALVLLPLVLGAVWYLPQQWLYLVFCGVGLLGAWEWTGMMRLRSAAARAAYLLLAAAALAGAWVLPEDWWPWVALPNLAWWVFTLFLIPGFPGNFERNPPPRAALALLGLVWLVPTILCLVQVRGHGDGFDPLRLMYTLALVWASDVGAYLAGRNLGRNKLAPTVSPGKTREGALGGLLLCAVFAAVAGSYVFQPAGLGQLALLVALSLAVAALSIVGDLGESMFKRLAGLKDSGRLLPGHGGILDRIDSLLAAAPAMALGLYWLGM
ncbi:MAG TPA: phosphatidate cytidylyltransferase [Nevskia sp.]|nr:phosphatidate cytidylyltransferase [Nevskia sp.]